MTGTPEEIQTALYNLLSQIFGDGGHESHRIGDYRAAAYRAQEMISCLRTELDNARWKLDRQNAEIHDLRNQLKDKE